MAEIELGDMKISGGKLLVVIPLLGTILGGMWAGFELYQRLLDAEEAIVAYVSPDFSHYDESLAVLQTVKTGGLWEDDNKPTLDRLQTEGVLRVIETTPAYSSMPCETGTIPSVALVIQKR